MIQITTNLFVGKIEDYYSLQDDQDFYFVQACKEPFHRTALGYTSRSAHKDHPEYLVAKRDNRLILNMIDSRTGKYFSNTLFDESLAFIRTHLRGDSKILIHCNQGVSRSPSIGLLYLASEGLISSASFEEAKKDFLEIYPNYDPKGIAEFLRGHWDEYVI